MRTMADAMNRPYFHPGVPGIFLKILYGEMSSLIMEGSRISSSKIINAGYRFEFDNLHDALSDIISRRSA
jgi:NAD dependent epimerase/dehydratase family enzyme